MYVPEGTFFGAVKRLLPRRPFAQPPQCRNHLAPSAIRDRLVVANGQAFYEKVLQNPTEMPIDLTFEPLLYPAANAYKRKTGKLFATISAFSSETYSNKRGWKT